MNNKFLSRWLILFLSVSFSMAGAVLGQEKSQKEKIKELSKKVDVLTEELERRQIGEETYKPVQEAGKYGLAPAASKVYQRKHGVSIGGYGEINYTNYNIFNDLVNQGDEIIPPPEFTDRADALRVVLYFGYKFTDKWILNTEIEYEHANELGVEFAYIDRLINDYVNFRAGLLLAPMGFINELHEPPIYLGVNRPLTETYIIPTTWREVGAGFFGKVGDFSYKAYLMNSFNGLGFSADKGIRGGRQKGSKALAHDLGSTIRVDYEYKSMILGVSYFIGNVEQNNDFNGFTIISDFHFDFNYAGFYSRLLFSFARLDGAGAINELNSNTGNQSVGEQLLGGYAQLGYDVYSLTKSEQKMIIFGRYEYIDTQVKVPAGFSRNPANEKSVITLGVSYKPILNISFKFDYQIYIDEAEEGVNRLNIGVGYIF